jgi:hypothetical protein
MRLYTNFKTFTIEDILENNIKLLLISYLII